MIWNSNKHTLEPQGDDEEWKQIWFAGIALADQLFADSKIDSSISQSIKQTHLGV